jgi:hypothetical protein
MYKRYSYIFLCIHSAFVVEINEHFGQDVRNKGCQKFRIFLQYWPEILKMTKRVRMHQDMSVPSAKEYACTKTCQSLQRKQLGVVTDVMQLVEIIHLEAWCDSLCINYKNVLSCLSSLLN